MRVDYHWDGDQLVGQQQWLADGNAARAVQWVYEPGSFRPLAQLEQQNGATQLHYIVTDLTGTARELCSEEGDVHWRGEQALWGEYREAKTPMALRRWLGDAANDEVSCDLRYPGQLYDAESGLYYNRHRYYDPELGQYISPDPIGMLGGLRPQGYVHNPVEWVDPLGLSGCPPDKPSKPRPFDDANFADQQKLTSHYEKHGGEFRAKSEEEYLQIGRDVMNNGHKVEYAYKGETRTGYVMHMGNTSKGAEKIAFVGTNSNGNITTIHTKSGKDIWKTLNGNAQDKVIRAIPRDAGGR